MRSVQPRRADRTLVVSAAIATLVAACSAPTPTPIASRVPELEASPGPPSVMWWFGTSWIYDGSSWTMQGYLDPHGEPTEVVVETGSGPIDSPTFTDVVPIGKNVIAPGPFDIRIAVHDDGNGVCVRLRATNALGSDTSEVQCQVLAFPTPNESIRVPATGEPSALP